MQPTGGTVSYVTLQTSAPASTLSLTPTVRSARPLQQRAGSKVLLRFMLQIATLSPTCQYPELIDCGHNQRRIRDASRVRLRWRCVPVTQSRRMRVLLRILLAGAIILAPMAAQTGDESLDIYTEHPRLFLSAQRLKLLRRERERRTTRWLQIETLMTGKAVMPEPGFANAL